MDEELSVESADVEKRVVLLRNAVNSILAEMDRLKQRVAADITNAQKYSVKEIAIALLPLRDALEKALSVETSDVEALRNGIALSLKMLDAAFVKNGIAEISPVSGERFNPRQHHAVSMVAVDRSSPYIVGVEKKGYVIGGRLLRRAIVTIAPEEPCLPNDADSFTWKQTPRESRSGG